MSETSRLVEASITAQNMFSDPLQVLNVPFNFSVSGTFVATVTIQRRFFDPAAKTWGTWFDVETYTVPKEDIGIAPPEGVQYRAGVKTGQFTSGTVDLRISQ